jgi:heptosyltransferase-2
VSFKRVLVWLKPGFIGDAVLSTPTLISTEAATPSLTVWSAPHLVDLLANMPGKAEFVGVGKFKGVSAFWRQVKRMRSLQLDTAILVNRSIRSALVTRFAGVPVRVGHDTERRGILLTKKVKYDLDQFEAQSYLDLIRALNIPILTETPQLWLTEEERANANEIPDGAWAVQPGSLGFKAIPTPVWNEVLSEMRARSIPIVLVGGAQERSFLEGLDTTGALDYIGKCSLRETMAVLAKVDRLLAADTGLVHIAAALGTPTRAAFGRTSASKWGYAKPPHALIKIEAQDLSGLSPEAYMEIAFG